MHTDTSVIEITRFAEFQRLEAEWVTRELEECVKLVQRYRSLYLTAVFLAVGWALSQIITATSASSSSGNPVTAMTFDSLRQRPNIAAVLCLVPFINVLFGLLMLEATAQIQSLARYRFLLGFELGGNLPVWRWECWKSSKHGSVRVWTNPLNVLFTMVIVLLTVAALWFSHPAIGGSRALVGLWWTALGMNLIAAAVIGVVAFKNRRHNSVAAPPPTTWSQLWPSK